MRMLESDPRRYWWIHGRRVRRICGGDGDGDGEPKPNQPNVTGGPGDPLPAQAFGEEITIGTAKFRVPKEAAAAIQAMQTAFDQQAKDSTTRIDELGNQITEIASRAPAPIETPAKPGEPQATDFGATLFENPNETLKVFGDQIVERITTNLTSQYTQAENLKTFWADFYRANDDLKDDQFLVDAMFSSEWTTIGQLKRPEAIKKLGDLTRERLVAYKGTPPEIPPDGGKTAAELLLESGGSGKAPAPKGAPKDDEKVVSLSEQIKANKIAKKKAGGSAG